MNGLLSPARIAVAAVLAAAAAGLAPGSAHAAYSARVDGGTLTLKGNGASETLVLRLQPGSPGTLQADVGADGTADFSFDRSSFTAIDVEAGGGDDEIRIDQSGGAFTDESVTMNGGAGDDTMIGGAGADSFVGGTGDDFADGNIGADRAVMGGGDDRFQWDPGDGSDTVEGQGGNDRLDFNGSNAGEQVAFAAGAGRVQMTRNVGSITMDLDGIEHVQLRTLGGSDVTTVGDLVGTELKLVDVDLDAIVGGGDGSADLVIARGTEGADKVGFASPDGRPVVTGLGAQTRVAGGEAALDDVVVQTLGGADTATMAVGVSGPTPLHVDGGDGDDTARYNGTAGPDEIALARDGTEVAVQNTASALFETAAVESMVVAGLDGGDTIVATNGIGTLTSLTLAGGDGDDDLRGADGADTIDGGRGNDSVDGNIGADRAALGAGDDRFQWDPGDGSDTVEGQSGDDRLDFNGSNIGEQIAVSANADRVRLTRNIASITMDLDGIEATLIRVLGGADTVAVGELSATDLKSVDVDLDATGGGGDGQPDAVVAQGTDGADQAAFTTEDGRPTITGLGAHTRVSGGEAALDDFVAALAGGADTATMTAGVASSLPLHADGGDGDDTARYNGTAGPDQIAVVRDGNEVAIDSPGSGLFESAVESTIVAGLDGDDTIAGLNGIGALTALTLEGGDGDDDLRGGDGADVLDGGRGDDSVDGNIGADRAALGAGDDRFQWDPGDGSDTVEGESGDDRLDFNGSNIGELIELSDNAGRLRLTRNIAAITMDTDGIEQVGVRALGGNDTVTVGDLSATTVRSVDVDLGASVGGGDGAQDTVVLDGTGKRDAVQVTRSGDAVAVAGLPAAVGIAGSEGLNDTLRIQTLGGDDDVTVAPDAELLLTPVIDLGADE